MADKRDYSKVTVKHIMADGSVRDSLLGYEFPIEKVPLVAINILREMLLPKENAGLPPLEKQ